MNYRPEIDGLRALAILVVLFFHADLGFPGGYVGVDVFFVISGYLITSIILKELRAGTFSLVSFWERRARRILPAGIVMVVVTAVAGWFLLLPSDFAAFGKSVVAQAVFAANFHFTRTTNYFAGPADEQPLLHTWSLAVEEQFYMVMPLLLLLLFRFPKTRERLVLALVLLAGFVISFGMSLWFLPRMPAATFYLLPTRAWELLFGSLIALVPTHCVPASRWLRELLAGCGLLGMTLPCFLYSKDTPFPGLAALPPCFGAVLFIWATSLSPGSNLKPLFLTRLFSCRPVVFVGLISYSLYLYHWPLVAFSHYWALGEIPLAQRWGIVVSSLILAVLSWRFVETPFRTKQLGSTRPVMFGYAIIGMTFVMIGGIVLYGVKGFPSRFSEKILAFDRVKNEGLHEKRITRSTDLADARSGRLPRLGAVEPAPVAMLVWGDSHARCILPAVVTAAENHGAAVIAAWHPSTPPLLDYVSRSKFSRFSLGEDGPAYAEAIVDYVRSKSIPVVLLVARWGSNFQGDAMAAASGHPVDVPVGKALLNTVKSLRKEGVKVLILRELPGHHASVPRALVQAEIFGTDLAQYICSSTDLAYRNEPFDKLVPELEEAGAVVIDLSNSLLSSDGRYFVMQREGNPLYYDNHHLSRSGAMLFTSKFDAIFRSLIQSNALIRE